MGIKTTKSDVLWSYAGTFMTLGSNFLLLPFLIYFLNGEEFGLWNVFLSIGGIVVLFDFGFNPTLARNVAYSWSGAKKLNKIDVVFVDNHQPNINLLKKLIYTCKRIYLIISLIALILLLTVGTLYVFYLSDKLNGYNHVIAWFIYCIAVFLNLFYGYYITFLRGVGAIKQLNIATVLSRTFQIVSGIILLFLGFGLIGVALSYLGYGLLFRLISKVTFYKYDNIGSRIENDDSNVDLVDIKETFVSVWHNAWRDGLVSIASYLSNQATVIIASVFLSLTATGIYSVSLQLVSALAAISGVLYSAYQPALQSAYINNNVESSKKMMSTSMTIYILLFWISFIALLVIGIPLLELMNPETIFNIPILFGIAIYTFLLKYHSFFASYISNTNKVPYMESFIISSFLGVILATILMSFTNFGVWGLIVAQIVVQGIYNNWMWPYRVMKSLNTNLLEMFSIGLKEMKRISFSLFHR